MTVSAGTRLGQYEVLAPLGAGGMGEVYRARDMKLGRDVAIKVLPQSVSHDPERLARFEREAKTLAALNHPNIAIVHGFQDANGIHAIVMELVDGPTLADRIAQGRIPIEETLPIAKQIADALEAAHDQGIVHRDLKPANIEIRTDGAVKVLDFGLAKAINPDQSGHVAALAHSPTITSPAMMTGAGIILGTAAYMSPEQAKGRPADKRSDVWAFGCVVYEMLTGARAFPGDDVSDTLAAVLRGEPDWPTLPSETPSPIRRLLRRALEKDRKKRLSDASDARLEIEDALTLPAADALSPANPMVAVPKWRKALPAAAAVMVGVAAAYVAWVVKPAPHQPITRFAISLREDDVLTGGFVMSPDGRRLAYALNDRLYLRSFDQLDADAVAGGDSPPLASPRGLFFSPDGLWLGFWESGQLKKVSVSGGAPVSLCAFSPPPSGAT